MAVRIWIVHELSGLRYSVVKSSSMIASVVAAVVVVPICCNWW